jgi:hypothetical protein
MHIYLSTVISIERSSSNLINSFFRNYNYLTLNTFERYLIVFKPCLMKKFSFKMTMSVIGMCALLSLFWSVLPLIGWSHYSLEKGLTSCSIEWSERNWNVLSYNLVVWFFGFALPLIPIFYCNLKLILVVNFSNSRILFLEIRKYFFAFFYFRSEHVQMV